MYEYFEHTADIGIHLQSKDWPSLLADAGTALFGLIVADVGTIRPLQSQQVRVAGTERDYLLFDWLTELLYLFDSQGLVLCRFDVTATEDGVESEVWGEPFDPLRHLPSHEVKAVTYHELRVTQSAEGWQADVIVDI